MQHFTFTFFYVFFSVLFTLYLSLNMERSDIKEASIYFPIIKFYLYYFFKIGHIVVLLTVSIRTRLKKYKILNWRPPRKNGLTPKTTKARIVRYAISQSLQWFSELTHSSSEASNYHIESELRAIEKVYFRL